MARSRCRRCRGLGGVRSPVRRDGPEQRRRPEQRRSLGMLLSSERLSSARPRIAIGSTPVAARMQWSPQERGGSGSRQFCDLYDSRLRPSLRRARVPR